MGAKKGLKYSALRVKPTSVERVKIKIMPVKKMLLTKVTTLKGNKIFWNFLARRCGQTKNIIKSIKKNLSKHSITRTK
jgi:hypothetical protein